MRSAFTLIEMFVVMVILMVIGLFFIGPCIGVGAFGPDGRVEAATVSRAYVDVSKSGDVMESHYMVATDKGVFEVDNSILMGIYNADEIYGQIREKNTYNFSIKGRKVVNLFFQAYPYIRTVECVATNR
jgi:hypothetical protein